MAAVETVADEYSRRRLIAAIVIGGTIGLAPSSVALAKVASQSSTMT